STAAGRRSIAMNISVISGLKTWSPTAPAGKPGAQRPNLSQNSSADRCSGLAFPVIRSALLRFRKREEGAAAADTARAMAFLGKADELVGQRPRQQRF